MSCQIAPITRSKENQQDASSPVSDLLLRSKQKLTSLRWIGWLRLGMIAQACGARKISKTLQDQSPTDCCGANISSHRFVQFDGDQGTPEGRQGVHPTPWQCTLSHACHAKAAETKGHRRDAGGTPEGRRRDAGGTPGRTSDPLAVHIVPRLPRKSGGDQGTPEGRRRDAGGTPEGRQGVHPTPWQCTLSHACHANAAETKGRALQRR